MNITIRMNNNCNSNNNDDKSINNNNNNNNNDNKNIKSLILLTNVFTSCSNLFKQMFLFIKLGNLFETERPIYETFLSHVSFSKMNFNSSVIIS